MQFVIEEKLNHTLPPQVISEIRRVAEELPDLEHNVVNATGVHKELSPTGDLHILFLIRNGSDETVNFAKLAMEVGTPEGVIAQITADFEDKEVKPNTNKLYALAIAAPLVNQETATSEDWHIKLFQA